MKLSLIKNSLIIEKLSNKKNNFLAFSLLFIQPIFMASNLIVARGGVEYVPPISLAFWRWTVVVLFFYLLLIHY